MKIRNIRYRGRSAWEMDNGLIRLVQLKGGGHIASLTHKDRPGVHPLWSPVWNGIEPWRYAAGLHAKKYASRLLSGICGHNSCLGWFGPCSSDEERQGMECHGEAGVARWRIVERKVGRTTLVLTTECDLPAAGMRLRRKLSLRANSGVVRVREAVISTAKRDLPYTMCQHVTFGPPFLEKGVTVFDMSATRGQSFPGKFGDIQRLKQNAAFTWPKGPGSNGKVVDMRRIGKEYRVSSDFSAQLMDPRRDNAWFSVINPKQGLLVAYAWKRQDYPWVGNWEENYCRKQVPWAGKSLARGMEFSNTPFPVSLRSAVDSGCFQGLPAYRWLPAKGRVTYDYDIMLLPVPKQVKGTREIVCGRDGLSVTLI